IRDLIVTGVQTCALPILERKVLCLVRHDADLAVDNFHQTDKFPGIAMAVLHADNVWTLDQPWKYRDRNFHFVVDRIVIYQKAERSEERRVGKECIIGWGR